MKKIFTLLMMCVLASAAWATDVTFDATVDVGTGSSTASAYTIEKNGVTIAVSNGMANGKHYRIYKGQTLTVSSTAGNVTQVVFTCTAEGDAKYGPGCFTASTGNYSYSGAVGTWDGNASNIVFTASTNQVRVTSIVVTVDDGTLSAPTISPAGGTYYNAVDVTITCSTSGASIYYTTDGSTPTSSSTLYTGGFTVTSNTTVKAISVKDGESSEVVSATYEIGSAVQVANIAAYQAVDDNTVVQFTNPVNVLAQNGKYMYVMDDTGYALFYGSTGKTYKNGDVIPAGFTGTKTTYGGEPELSVTTTSGFESASSNSPIDPTTITCSQVSSDLFAHYVYIENATIDADNKTITDASGTAAIYFNMGVASSSIDASKTYNVTAVIGSYGSDNTIYQVLPVKATDVNGGDTEDGVNIAGFQALSDNSTCTFKNDVTTLYQSGRYLFVKDDSGYMLVYGDVDQTYSMGNVIPKGFGGTKTTYNGEPELTSPTGFQASTSSVTVTPEEIATTAVAHATFGHYVVLRSVLINTSDNTLTDASGNTCAFYNNTFKASLPTDLTKRYDVYGIVGSYGKTNTVYQVLPINITEEGGGAVSVPDVASLSDLYNLNSGTNAHFTVPMTAIYQNGNNMYVKVEGEYALVYGKLSNSFVNGDIINDAVASWTTYNSITELIPVDSTFTVDGHGAEVEPEMMPVEEISQDMIHTYVGWDGVQVVMDSTNYYRVIDETGEMIMYNKFNKTVEIPEIDASKTYDVRAFVTVYKSIIELYPISVVEHGGTSGLRGDVNEDGEVTIADVNAVIDLILSGSYNKLGDVNEDGEVTIADVNAVIDIILSNS